MATRLKRSGGTLRRPTISLGFTPGGRGSLLDAINTNSAADAKAARTEALNNALEDMKNKGQDVLNGDMSLKDFMSFVNGIKSQYSEKSGTIATFAASVAKNLDTQNFNNYINGGDLKDFKKYYDERKSDGIGNLDYLNSLWGKAQQNEDTLKFNAYVKGDMKFEDFMKYANDRVANGGNADKLGTYVAQAKTHEDQLKDANMATLYNSGLLSGADYEKYLQDRISNESNATNQTNLKSTFKSVQDNEWSKQANDVIAQYQGGSIDGGTAIARLNDLMGQTNDAKLQQAALQHIGSIKSALASQGTSASTTLNKLHSDAVDLFTKAKERYDNEEKDLGALVSKGKPGDAAGLIQRILNNDAVYQATLSMAAKGDPNDQWKSFYTTEGLKTDASQQTRIMGVFSTIADNLMKDADAKAAAAGGATGDPYKGMADAAAFWINTAAQSGVLDAEHQAEAFRNGQDMSSAAQTAFNESADGVKFNSLVNNIVTGLKGNDMGKSAVDYMDKAGIDYPKTVGADGKYAIDGGSIRDWVAQILAGAGGANPDVLRQILAGIGAEGYSNQANQVYVNDPTGKATTDTSVFQNRAMSAQEFANLVASAGAAAYRGVADTVQTVKKSTYNYIYKITQPGANQGLTEEEATSKDPYAALREQDAKDFGGANPGSTSFAQFKAGEHAPTQDTQTGDANNANQLTEGQSALSPSNENIPGNAQARVAADLGQGNTSNVSPTGPSNAQNAMSGIQEFLSSIFGGGQAAAAAPSAAPAPAPSFSAIPGFNSQEAFDALAQFANSEHVGSPQNPIAPTPTLTNITPVSIIPPEMFSPPPPTGQTGFDPGSFEMPGGGSGSTGGESTGGSDFSQ